MATSKYTLGANDGGDVFVPEHEPNTWAQDLFLEHVAKKAPQVVSALWDCRDAANRDPGVLQQWARKHRLDCPWVIQRAAETLAFWREYRNPDADTAPSYFGPREDDEKGCWVAEYEQTFTFNRLIEDEVAFIDRVRREIRDARTARAKEAKTKGLKDAPQKDVKHFDWLVQFQVLELSQGRIATRANEQPKAVQKAVRRLATLIDLPLRTDG